MLGQSEYGVRQDVLCPHAPHFLTETSLRLDPWVSRIMRLLVRLGAVSKGLQEDTHFEAAGCVRMQTLVIFCASDRSP